MNEFLRFGRDGERGFMETKFTMKELPISERPYEKAEVQGVNHLSDKELFPSYFPPVQLLAAKTIDTCIIPRAGLYV